MKTLEFDGRNIQGCYLWDKYLCTLSQACQSYNNEGENKFDKENTGLLERPGLIYYDIR